MDQLSAAIFYSINFWIMHFQAPTFIAGTGKNKKKNRYAGIAFIFSQTFTGRREYVLLEVVLLGKAAALVP